jgi:hypothetical protein
MAELGDVEASLFEQVDAQMILLGGSCEFASRPIQPAGRGLPRKGRRSGVAFSLVTFLLAKQEKVTCCRATPDGFRHAFRRRENGALLKASKRPYALYRNAHPTSRIPPTMHTERIPVRITQTGQIMEVVVFDRRADHITVALGEGIYSVKCELTPATTAVG